KSTLSNVLAGREDYRVTEVTVTFDGQDLLALPAETRACEGLFLGFQYPVEIPGVSNMVFLKAALNARRKHQGLAEVDAMDFLTWVKDRLKKMGMDAKMMQRGVNEDFSGGEKKRNEILQMLVLAPRLMILDETDSGLDIDALKIVSEGINTLRSPERATLLITHYQRLLDYVEPDFVHVLAGGRIVKSGGPELARELEEKGYGWLEAA
ncbi:MAG TPA: Fe-S cluster assembly ATPase SufC, partial [Stenotrophobium sp.]|nr:Fe-S cluster assembly ATPase SufC [Stenotrophobium sp.]